MTSTIDRPGAPVAFLAGAGLGLVWSAFGVVQFWRAVTATPEALVASGMTPAQADLYAGLPAWMNAAFAVGVLGGVVGCALLLLRRRAAVSVLAASLAGYLVLFVGDIVHGVFEAFGVSQAAILTGVVAIAASLLWLARGSRCRAVLA